MRRSIPVLLGMLCFACGPSENPKVSPGDPIDPPATGSVDPGPGTATRPPAAAGYARLDRLTFNRMAQRLNLPVYWASDENKNGAVDPDEVSTLLFYPTSTQWTVGEAFTPDFATAYEKLVIASQAAPPAGADAARQAKLIGELDEASSVLVRTNMHSSFPWEVKLVKHMLEAARLIDDLYAAQSGVSKVVSKIAPDAASQSVFRRNWGPSCRTPKFEKDKECTAAPGQGEAAVDVWPEAMQKDSSFCKKLEDDKANKALLTPFTAVREEGGKLVAVGYEKAYGPQMKKVAVELRAAAKDLAEVPDEKALIAYLEAAATAFETNKWEPADEAWAKMNARNSKWYLRIGPDEVYWEPCSQKAGFHMSFARIDRDSLAWQDKLTPVQQQMEDDLAKLIGEPYKARKATFHLPDFIQVVANAGDSRDPIGATIGQSLPNWGPVANQSRGRTVVMSNLYTDPDSLAVRRAKSASLLSEAAMKRYADGGPSMLGTVLHEAAHNLGPAHEYKYQGKVDKDAFGGDLASMLEELKAQSGAYYYLYMLQDKGIINQELLERTITDSLVWGLNHISRGMYTASGQRKAYSQLAAVQVGFFMDEGGFLWDPKGKAANGTDSGAFSVDFSKMRAASAKMMKTVATIKAKNDKKAALDLANRYVEKATSKVPHDLITERMLRFPQPNFVYAINW